MLIQYKVLSKFYGLLDVIYFRSNNHNPRKAILEQIPENKAVKVMELCVGTASNSLLIAKNRPKASVYGIDRSREMLEIASKKITEQGLLNLQVRRRDATDTGIKAESFDYIVISLVLHESSPELATGILSEAKRLLKKDGRLFILEWEVPHSLLKKLLFYPISKMEPKGFNEFVHKDFDDYFMQHGLRLMNTIHCDYSRVFEVVKGNKDK